MFKTAKDKAVLAAKALQATGKGAVVAELFARTFYRNAHRIGLQSKAVSPFGCRGWRRADS
jgi:hypothetical protein